MARLSKQEMQRHEEADALVNSTKALSVDEKLFILENWHEGATHMNARAGAFFTPIGLARDAAHEIPFDATTIVDLCAGIGVLSYAAHLHLSTRQKVRFVCVESNPDYVRVGQRVLPEALWICEDVLKVRHHVDWRAIQFDCAISNPPFGRIRGADTAHFEYEVIAIAQKMARYGVFILPQGSLPWAYSGERNYREMTGRDYDVFRRKTGISLDMNSGFDTSIYDDEWKAVKPRVEIAVAEFVA